MSDRLRTVVMGVSGSGKSTIGELVAERLRADYVDADAAHPRTNIDKMSAGIPLTDEDRWPWLDRLRHELTSSERIVVTCSALKRSYRDRLRQAGDVSFVYLEVDESTVRARVGEREGHFMKGDMVASQFATLERPDPDEPDVMIVDARTGIEHLVARVVDLLDPAAG